MGERIDGLAIDRGAEVPIGVQLAWALRTRIGDGTLRPGQRLPGLRDLAHELGVNLNTVRAAYQRLEREGLLESQQGSGTFIARTPRAYSAARAIAATAAREAQQTGVDPRDVAAALYVGAASPERSAPGAPEASSGAAPTGQRRALRRQIAALERALGELEAEYPGVARAPARTRGSGPALLGVAELAQARSALVQRLVSAQRAIDAHLAEPQPPNERASAGSPLVGAQKARRSPTARGRGSRGSARPARPAPATG